MAASAPTIGLNVLFLEPGATGGMEVYARALIPELVRAWPEARWVAFGPRDLAGEPPLGPGVRQVTLPVRAASRVQRVAAEQTLLPAAAARHGVDLLHSLATTMPAVTPGMRTVTTVHDLIYARFPETHTRWLRAGMGALARVAARRADRIVADSDATRRDLGELLGVPSGRIDVVPLGPGAETGGAPTPAAELRARLGLGDAPVVLSVSAKRPHKNLARLVEAVARSAADPAPVLVVPGYANPHETELRALADRLGAAGRVRVTGWTSDGELEGLYALSTVMAFPSLYEGFGLPVLEAMRRGVPVACSNASSLPEVAGDAALLFDPHDPEAVRAAVDRLLADPALRADLAARGRARAASFSWSRTAAETVAAYRRALA